MPGNLITAGFRPGDRVSLRTSCATLLGTVLANDTGPYPGRQPGTPAVLIAFDRPRRGTVWVRSGLLDPAAA